MGMVVYERKEEVETLWMLLWVYNVASVFFSQEGWNSGNEESELVYKLFRGRIQPSYKPQLLSTLDIPKYRYDTLPKFNIWSWNYHP